MKSEAELVGRRAELLAELFLQDLNPQFVARAPSADYVFDFFMGLKNRRGGVNLIAVEVKSSEEVRERIQVAQRTYQVLANSNIPAFLLVVNVKMNRFFVHFPKAGTETARTAITVPLTEVNEANRSNFRKVLLNLPPGQSETASAQPSF